MDSADAATPLGAWAWIRGYFSPATLFLVVNLVIGTIALTSRATQQRRRREHYYHDDAHGHHLQEEPMHPQMEQPGYGHYYHPEQTLYAPPPAPAPLARTSSVLDRLRSLGLYRFCSSDFPPEYGAAAAAAAPNYAQDVSAPVEEEETTATTHYAKSRLEPAPAAGLEDERRLAPAPPRVKKSGSEVRKSQVARAAPRTVEAVAENDDSVEEAVGGFRRGPSPLQQEYHYQEEYVPPPARARAPAPVPLQRTSSVLDRLRSFGLYRFRSGDLGPDLPAAAETEEKEKQEAAHYGRSRSEPAREQGKKKQEARMSKSSSSGVVEEAETEQCVNARADDFINKFKQQLQLQRLNSLLNYKEMLNRGGGGKQ